MKVMEEQQIENCVRCGSAALFRGAHGVKCKAYVEIMADDIVGISPLTPGGTCQP
jgi:hypothetical protein